MIKIEQLTEVVWRFSRSNGDVISDSMILQSDGSIGGPGVVESRWRLSDGKLAIMMADGTVTTWFQVDQQESSASLRLVGEFELRRGHGMFHILEAVRSKDTLTDVAPATSSLPGGTRREAVHYPLRLVWRREFDDFLHARRIYTQFKFDEKGAYAVGEAVEIAAPCHVEAYANLPHRSFCTMGAFSYSISPLGPGTIVGRYCSLAFGISLMDHAHPVDRITTSPLTYDRSIAWFARSDFGGELDILDFAAVFPEPPVIGHDVWIGNGVLIGSGIKIGHGSIIGARSIVTRDVPPYSVVAGSPAIVRRMRFDDKTVERFLKQCWWDYAFYQLPSCWTDPVAFLDRLEEGVGRGIIHKLDARRYDVGLELSRLDALLRNQG